MIHQGDCLTVMRTMEPESVDAITTDPPYGLSFMGRDWDHGIPGIPFWAEALRIAKPGAHLLAFGGTRTFHRLACAIEDAGWEIRDTLSWMYGSGFPKSLDVGKAMDKAKQGFNDEELRITTWLADHLNGTDKRAIAEALGVPQTTACHWFAKSLVGNPNVPDWDRWLTLKALLAFGDEMDAEVWRLNGRKGQPGESWHEREVIGENPNVLRAHRSQNGTIAFGGAGSANVTTAATDLAKQWDGWGTALKPGWEPIILARKPLIGTVAANVTLHGTGALNIDATRIGYGNERVQTAWPNRTTPNSPHPMGSPDVLREYDASKGRWPANVVLSHTPDCREVGTRKVKGHKGYPKGPGGTDSGSAWSSAEVSSTLHKRTEPWPGHPDTEEIAWECVSGCPVRMLDEQSGERPSGGGKKNPNGAYHSARTWNTSSTPGHDKTHEASTGGASRFYYCAKASRAEREMGLDGMPPKASWAQAHKFSSDPRMDHEQTRTASVNHHPTVKPIALMRWLCRLITPPNGLILDPFCGSGSTGCAAVLEGFRFAGIEQDAEYCAIAEKRIAHCRQQPSLWDVA